MAEEVVFDEHVGGEDSGVQVQVRSQGVNEFTVSTIVETPTGNSTTTVNIEPSEAKALSIVFAPEEDGLNVVGKMYSITAMTKAAEERWRAAHPEETD